jgi:hypothetical protein
MLCFIYGVISAPVKCSGFITNDVLTDEAFVVDLM